MVEIDCVQYNNPACNTTRGRPDARTPAKVVRLQVLRIQEEPFVIREPPLHQSSESCSAGLPFSDAVLVGDTLYISGRIGIDPATGEAPESIDAELELLFEGFQAVLREAGMTMDDLVWVQVYSPDVSLWQRFNAAYVKLFSREFPARAFLGSGTLLLKGRFEMLGIAVKDRS